MTFCKILFICLTFLYSASASASVVYRWHMTESSDTVFKAGGLLELADYGADSYSLEGSCHQDPCDWSNPSSPIIRFEFWTNNTPHWTQINFVTGDGINMWDPVVNINFTTTGRRIYDFNITLWTFDTYMRMEQGTIIQLSTDWEGCQMHCEGSSGYFQQIPEPGTFSLLGIGMSGIAFGFCRRRKGYAIAK